MSDKNRNENKYICDVHGLLGNFVGMEISWHIDKSDFNLHINRKYCGKCLIEFYDDNLCQLKEEKPKAKK